MTQEIYNKLINDLIKYSESYYNRHISLVSDKEFDMLIKQAEAIEAAHPEWIREDSPTQKVGIASADGKTKHKRKMLSLQNTYNREEVLEWFNKMQTEYNVKTIVLIW